MHHFGKTLYSFHIQRNIESQEDISNAISQFDNEG